MKRNRVSIEKMLRSLFTMIAICVSVTDSFDDYSQNNYVCWENRVDFVIQLANELIFAFRHDKVWHLTIDGNYLSSTDNPVTLNELFPNLRQDIPIAFTMPLIDDRMRDHLIALPGLTMFVDPPMYYLYHNFVLNLTDTMQYWESGPFLDNRFTATMHNTSLLLIAKQGIIPDGIKKVIGGQVFLFDSDRFPEWVGVFEIESKYKQNFDWLRLSQLMPIDPGKHEAKATYLALFDYGPTMGHYYCITMFDNHNHGQCLGQLRPISSVLRCSPKIIKLKYKNSLYKLWKSTGGLPLGIIIMGSCGAAMTMLILNLLQLFNSLYLVATLTQFGHSPKESVHSILKSSLTSFDKETNIFE